MWKRVQPLTVVSYGGGVNSPDLMQRALAMEDGFRSGPHWRPDGTTKGLGQRRWSWRELLAAEGKLPGEAAEQPCGCYDGGEE